jgi:predicted Fe-Mo cluster-binding NifX family protein
MKIGISSTGKDLDAVVDQRFGRCQYFLIVDSETMKLKAISNESTLASGGAGIQAAQIVTKEGVNSVITGNIGPNAFSILQSLKKLEELTLKVMLELVVEDYEDMHTNYGKKWIR